MPAVELETPATRNTGILPPTSPCSKPNSPGKLPPSANCRGNSRQSEHGQSPGQRGGVAGPGFINFRLDRSCLYPVIAEVLPAGRVYGRSDTAGAGGSTLSLYRPTSTGDLHIGHARNAAVGDSLSRIMVAAGYDVHREYYINDAGNQITQPGLVPGVPGDSRSPGPAMPPARRRWTTAPTSPQWAASWLPNTGAHTPTCPD